MPRQRTTRWDKMAAAYRANNPECEACGAPADGVDHVLPRSAFSLFQYEDSNLQSLCWRCHGKKSAFEPKAIYSLGVAVLATRIIVCGLPGSGKTRWAKQWAKRHAKSYPKVWDADVIAKELGVKSNHSEVVSTMYEFLREWLEDDRPFCIIRTDPMECRKLALTSKAIVALAATAPGLCAERVKKRDRGMARDRRLTYIRDRCPDYVAIENGPFYVSDTVQLRDIHGLAQPWETRAEPIGGAVFV